jgi:hypothetical protein
MRKVLELNIEETKRVAVGPEAARIAMARTGVGCRVARPTLMWMNGRLTSSARKAKEF